MAMSTWVATTPRPGAAPTRRDKPTLIPVPSLLRSLLSDHLDPGIPGGGRREDSRESTGQWWQAWAWQIAARC